jgi:T-complex protein 1 subunit delta|tara:strand:+ start:287 stop:1945 length:1659 start_codon:yes stop_codon:yes gene_type:complete
VKGETLNNSTKASDVRTSNIIAAKAIANAVRTSLGPRGMDKMIKSNTGEVLISNDGATILDQMQVFHPCAKMLVQLSKSQDIEAGDGTTSVVVIAGSLLDVCSGLLDKGIHPTLISSCFRKAEQKTVEILRSIADPVARSDRETLVQLATTSLASKVISANAYLLAPMAVDAVLAIAQDDVSSPSSSKTKTLPSKRFQTMVDLRDIKIVKSLGGTIDDSELVDGLCFNKGCAHSAGGPTRVENAKVALIQFCVSAPKTDLENSVVVSEYTGMDRLIKAERKYILGICKKIKKSGCNVLLIQKSILRDAYNALALHFLAKMKIMVITDVERTDVEFICRTIGCLPVAQVDSLTPDKLGVAGLVEEQNISGHRVVKLTEVPNPGHTVSLLLRGSNALVLEEADRSLHDALCVVRALVKEPYMIVGGGAPEVQVSLRLARYAQSLPGMESYCFRAFAEALEVIPLTLAENAGLHPIQLTTQLKALHATLLGPAGDAMSEEEKTAIIHTGIDIKNCAIGDLSGNVLQPLLVNMSAIGLATECVCMILKIDDLVATR